MLAGLVMVFSATGGALGAVDPASIKFNKEGEPITGELTMNVGDKFEIYYNVYDSAGDAIGTVNTWTYSPTGLANVTSEPGGHHFTVNATKAGKLTLTVTARGDTTNLSQSVIFNIKAPGGKSQPKKSPGFEALSVLVALTALGLCLRGRRRR